MVEVANKMAAEALSLAANADSLYQLDRVSEGDKALVQQVREAAQIVAAIAQDIASQETARVGGEVLSAARAF